MCETTGWRSPGLVVHAARLPEGAKVTVSDLPVTSASRTALDLARRQPLPRALVPLDAVLRRRVANTNQGRVDIRSAVHVAPLIDECRQQLLIDLADTGWVRGARSVLGAVLRADPASESPAESISRGIMLKAGLPAPVCGYMIRLEGRSVWADMAWPELGIVGEVDGRMKYQNPDDLYREKEREDALRRADWTVVRWTAHEAMVQPEVVIARLRRAITGR